MRQSRSCVMQIQEGCGIAHLTDHMLWTDQLQIYQFLDYCCEIQASWTYHQTAEAAGS